MPVGAAQTVGIHEHQPTEPIGMATGEPDRQGAARETPDQSGRRWACPLDQLGEPFAQARGGQRAIGRLRSTVTRKVGGDHSMGPRQLRDDAHPDGCELTQAVQQDDWRAVTALQHGGREAGQLQPSLGEGARGQQPLTGVLPSETLSAIGALGPPADCCHVVGSGSGHGVLLAHSRGPPLRCALARKARIGGTTHRSTVAVGSFRQGPREHRVVRRDGARTRRRWPQRARARRAW